MAAQATTYASRRGAVRAARQACKAICGPHYLAAEGPDYFIHPQSRPFEIRDRFSFELSPSMVAEKAEREALGKVPTTCIEHQDGAQTLRLSFQIKVF